MSHDEAKLAALKFAREVSAATRRATIEECAAVADSFRVTDDTRAECIAKAIRSLNSKQTPPPSQKE